MINVVIPVLGLLLLGGIIYWVYRKNREFAPGRQRSGAGSARQFAGNAGSLWRRFAAWAREWQARRLGLDEQPAATGPSADFARLRTIPSVRLDPAIMEPAPNEPPLLEQIRANPAPPDITAAAARIAAYEPETDADLAAFMRSEASGFVALSTAWHQFAETCTSSVGLDPAFAAALVELGDTVGDSAHDVLMAYRRFAVIYAQILEAVASGTLLPHNARQFLTAEGL